jgi:hypothetical protein
MPDLDALERMIAGLSPEQKASLDKVISPELNSIWKPTSGPQREAYYSQADQLFYGGAAGGGKSDLILGLALTKHERSAIFRLTYKNLTSLIDRMHEIRGERGGWNGQLNKLRTPSVAIDYGALQLPGSEADWQGHPHDLKAFDEAPSLSEERVKTVMGWNRSATGHRCRVLLCGNPPMGGQGAWIVRWFAPWLDPYFDNPAKSGELRWFVTEPDGTFRWVASAGEYDVDGRKISALSRTFIPAKLSDNPYLRDTNYLATLAGFSEDDRKKLIDGDFFAIGKDDDLQVIPSMWIDLAVERYKKGKRSGLMSTLGVDIAQGGADKTVISPLYGERFEPFVVKRGTETKDGVAVAGLIVQHMRDSCSIGLDCTGAWGNSTHDHLKMLGIHSTAFVVSKSPTVNNPRIPFKYYNLRAQLWWEFRLALDPNGIHKIELPDDRSLIIQLKAPLYSIKGDKVLVESKDELRKRLGTSTDYADAALMAWALKDKANYRRLANHGGDDYDTAIVNAPF